LSLCASQARDRALLEAGPNHARFNASALSALPVELLQRVLAMEIERLQPQAALRLDRLERAAQRLTAALSKAEPLRLTLAGLVIDLGEDGLSLNPAPPRRRIETVP
jgi:tRNA(Ile)-lysidine synthase